MGSKGTSTQTQQGTSTYTPNPQILGAGSQALGQAQSAAQSPFQLPVAPVAGFTPDQLQAFQQTQQQQGMAQPYYNQAQGLFNQSAAPISGSQVNNYLNPYAGYVMQNLAEQQGQQMNDLTGKATQAAGGVGADRIGVAQGELARQQSLASGQTLSGIYGSALSAAQQDAQRQQSAAYGIGQLGGASQNAAMQGTQALYGMGSQQQQLNQAQLNAPYQNQLAQIAYPYQQAQYLAGITGSLAGAMGGTTYSNQNGSNTPAQPSIFSQIAGAGTAGIGALGAFGAFGSNPTYGNGNMFSGDAYGGSSGSPIITGTPGPTLNAGDYGPGYASGGEASGEPSWMTADPTIPTIAMHASQVQQPKVQPLNMSSDKGSSGPGIGDIIGSVAKLAPLFLARGGAAYPKFADGGETVDYIPESFEDRFRDAATMGQIERPRFAESPTLGDMPRSLALSHYLNNPSAHRAYNDPGNKAMEPVNVSPNASASADPQSAVINPGNPYREPSREDTQKWRADTDTIQGRGAGAGPTKLTVNPVYKPLAAAADDDTPRTLAQLSPVGQNVADSNRTSMQGRTYDVPYKDLDLDNTSRQLSRNPWTALISAGAGMMAGSSPFAGVNIGKGMQEGLKTLESQRSGDREDEAINQRAKQLAMQAEQHLDEYTRVTPAQAMTAEAARATREQNKWQLVYDPTSGQPFWSKQGETPIPALPGSRPPDAASSPAAGNAAPAGTTPPIATPPDKTDFSYHPPSADPASGPGPIFNPKTGAIGIEQAQITRKDMDDARIRGNAAADAAMQVGQLKQAFAQIDELSKGGLLQTGAYAEQRNALAKTINTIGASFGTDPATGKPYFEPINSDLIGAGEEVNKLSTRLGFALSRTLGSREAQQIVKQAIDANPGLNNTPQGRKYIIASMDAAIARDRENAQFITDYRRRWRTTAGAEAEFNKLNPPEKYAAQAGVATAPPEFQKPEALKGAVMTLRAHKDDPRAIALFNQIYHGTAAYFLKD